jgi:RNA polymerase sigma factor for flagellar operon FliA
MSAIAEIVFPQQNQLDNRPIAPVIPLQKWGHAEDHLDLVYSVVNRLRIAGNAFERGDLISIGMVGLLEAAKRYRPCAGVPFRSFAEVRIKGALLDALRVTDWVGRTIRNRLRMLRAADQQLTQKLGRSPDSVELADALGCSLNELSALKSRLACPESFLEDYSKDGTHWEDYFTTKDTSALDGLCGHEENQELMKALSHLPPREQEVIRLSFFEEATLKEIGNRLGVTEARACQLRAQGMNRLREALSKKKE